MARRSTISPYGGGRMPAPRYLSADMTGYETLDSDGNWESVDGYGPVWFPTTVPDDWAPYRYGHWRWIAPWGWTWIDAMPWGFAPSHFGRWALIAGSDPGTGRWGWVPGKRDTDPVYAPALVAFLGTAEVGLSYPDASGPAVGWFPLAPGEVYWPSYTGDLDAIRRLNADAVGDVATIGPALAGGPPANVVNGKYRNRRFASVVPRPVFLAGRPVASALVRLPDQRLDNAPLLAGSPHLAPPLPHAAAAAVAAARADRPVLAAHPKLTRPTRIAARDRKGRWVRPVRVARAVRRAHARYRVRLVVGGHWRAPGARLVRPHVIAAVASRSTRLRLRFAAAHHRAGR
jgi:Family of unknown function (DUF6600)